MPRRAAPTACPAQANLVVFGLMLAARDPEAFATRWSLVAAHPAPWTFFTSQFLHAGIMHVGINMLFLLVFGDNVEDAFGPVPFLLLYFAGGLAGALFFVASNPGMTVPSLGASGCISTLAGAYLVLFFGSRVGVRLMFLVFTLYTVHMRAAWVMLLWFGADVYRTFAHHGVLPATEGGVNFVAHGMGFALGVVVALFSIVYGVRRRYDALPEGSALFGYWPVGLEAAARRRRVLHRR